MGFLHLTYYYAQSFVYFVDMSHLQGIQASINKWWFVSLQFSEHTTSSSSSSKRPRLDQIPAANLDADDPLTDVGATCSSTSHLKVCAFFESSASNLHCFVV